MEGDPLYEPGRGLEYLFGCWMPDDEPPFRAFWGTTRAGERAAFESFIDFVIERRSRYPSLHVYHYASDEKSALRRLAQEHRTKENEVDVLLRESVLVDLYAVVRQSLAISEDGYGLKKVERFYELTRGTEVQKGGDSIVMFERWMLERDQRILDDIEDALQRATPSDPEQAGGGRIQLRSGRHRRQVPGARGRRGLLLDGDLERR
jgi:predicted RecB family nuclease